MSHRSPPAHPHRRWAALVALLALPAAGWLLFGNSLATQPYQPLPRPRLYPGLAFPRPGIPGSGAPRKPGEARPFPEPQFSQSPTPDGPAAFDDLHLTPVRFTTPLGPAPGLIATYQNGLLTLTSPVTHATIWSGPVAMAAFTDTVAGGVHLVADITGQAIWSRAADNSGAGEPDRRDSFRFEAAEGAVTVADRMGRPLGQTPIEIVILHRDSALKGRPAVVWPVMHYCPNAMLDAPGTLLLTFRNRSGYVFRRATVYRDADGPSGIMG